MQREQQRQSLGGKKMFDGPRSWPAVKSVVWDGIWEWAGESMRKPGGHIRDSGLHSKSNGSMVKGFKQRNGMM